MLAGAILRAIRCPLLLFHFSINRMDQFIGQQYFVLETPAWFARGKPGIQGWRFMALLFAMFLLHPEGASKTAEHGLTRFQRNVR